MDRNKILVEKSGASSNTYQKKSRWLTFLSFFIILNALLFYGFIRDETWLIIAMLLVPVHYKLSRIDFFYEPRDMIFKKDSLGFRNNSDYLSQSFILVTDTISVYPNIECYCDVFFYQDVL
jgi:hypothetical protein